MLETTSPRNMKTFAVIWVGQLISLLGSGLTSFALGVWIYQQTGQATPFAITVLLGTLPRILLSPLAGSLADRWNRRWMMILSDSGSALVTLGVVLLLGFGQLQIWHIYLVALISALFGAFQEPAFTASITMLVPKKDLTRAAGLNQLSQSVELLIAPALAGFLFVQIGLRGIILIDFITYFFALGALLIVRIPQPKVEKAIGPAGKTILKDLAFGWNYLRQRPGLFGLLLFFALVNFLFNFSAVLTTPLVLSTNSAESLGLVHMAGGLGLLAGSTLMSTWGGPKRRIRAVVGFIALSGMGLLVAGLHPHALVIGAGLALLHFSIPLASGPSQAIFQIKIEPAVQGRVFAMRSMISRSIMPLAFAISGPLADRVFEPLMLEGGLLAGALPGKLLGVGPGRGIGLMLVLSMGILLAACAIVYTNPRIRNVEEELPDAEEAVLAANGAAA